LGFGMESKRRGKIKREEKKRGKKNAGERSAA
jgi:hypothetical protein